MKYHKEIYFPIEHNGIKKIFISHINKYPLSWSIHAKGQFKDRIKDIEGFFQWYNKIKLTETDIIEYTVINGDIEKALFRLPYNNEHDIVLSISKWGKILTLWKNRKGDNHETLNIYQYEHEKIRATD